MRWRRVGFQPTALTANPRHGPDLCHLTRHGVGWVQTHRHRAPG